MKRLHVHVSVDNLEQSTRFYTALFGAEPVKQKENYAKWTLDNPSVNFAISVRDVTKGLDHLGIQVDDESELEEIRERLKQADLSMFDEGETVCCYAKSDKSWVQDPGGIAWEAYRNMSDAEYYSEPRAQSDAACCVPKKEHELASHSPAATGCC